MGNAKSTADTSSNATSSEKEKNNATLPSRGSKSNLNSIKSSGSSANLAKPKINAPSDKSQKRLSKGGSTARSSMSSEGKSKPILPLNHRTIIKYCMDNAKDDLGDRIYRRVIDKREDFRAFVETIPKAKRLDLSDGLKIFLQKVVDNLTDSDEIQRIAEEYGEKHVQYRANGFRPDFFAITADAITTECVFLDAAVHQATETLTAWSTLTTTVFSSVRDGFYTEMRRLRRASNSTMSKLKISTSIDLSSEGGSINEDQCSHRSISPNVPDTPSTTIMGGPIVEEQVTMNPLQPSESSKFLSLPQVH